ncbi:adenylate/guanylate cyclase domain-containing protein [Ruegeria arenilitoris]|uniref:adenylate/guanylate cyclase domain-containing protein n=1 Tax=Ruegeria arenilitoris TaxID=1173585 RepID=UPI0020C3A745|nr:adenylate/guanylate cyclase domain-containing protein [Ruegeria arenilitoris]
MSRNLLDASGKKEKTSTESRRRHPGWRPGRRLTHVLFRIRGVDRSYGIVVGSGTIGTMTEIGAYLEELGLSKYAPVFASNEITFSDLAHLSEHDLIDLGLPLGPRRRLMAALGKTDVATSPASRGDGKIVAERRQLTVMFVDLVGSTAMSERLDPEDLGELIRRFKEICTTSVARFGGHVASFMGDGAMIYFGYPHAQEDAASRAIHAGLDILEGLKRMEGQERLRARIGVSTGLVVVGTIHGEGLKEHDVVMGRTPNLAARLQSLAEPDMLVISPATRRLVGKAFEMKELGQFSLKGISEKVQTWVVTGQAHIERRFDIMPDAGAGRLVGRQAEFRKICDKWHEASQGAGQSVLITGEAGIGKSRLIEGLGQQVTEDDARQLNFQCSSFHENSALYPVIQHLERAAGFVLGDTDAQKLEKLAHTLRHQPKGHLRLIADLLSVEADDVLGPLDLPPQVKLEQTLEAITDQLASLARDKPVLLLLEDAHWVDPTTLSLTDRVIQKIRGLPVLIVVTARPGFDPGWGHYHNTLHIPLKRLEHKDVAAIVTDVAGGNKVPADVCDLIAAKTDGIPLYVQEVTRGLLESGQLMLTDDGYVLKGTLPSLSVPNTLKDSLMERLDRLGMAKDVAQTGAVFGRQFSIALLTSMSILSPSVLQAGLDQLSSAGIILQAPDAAKDEFVFRHALIRDMAYDSLLRTERQELHDRAADALLQNQPQMVQTQPEVLAQHFTLAKRPDDAVEHWQKAGRRAIERSAQAEALTHLSTALEQLGELPKSRERDLQEIDIQILRAGVLRSTSGISGEATGKAYGRLRDLCHRADETERLFPVLNGLYAFHLVRAEYRLAQEVAAQILDLAADTGKTEHRMVGHRAMGAVQLHLGNLLEARKHLEKAWSLYDFDQHSKLAYVYGTDHAAITSAFLGTCYCLMGLPDEAAKVQRTALDWAKQLKHVHSVAQIMVYMCKVQLLYRDLPALFDVAEPLTELAEEHSLPFMATIVKFWTTWAEATKAPVQENIEKLRQSAEDWWSIGAGNYKSFFPSLIAELLVETGDHSAAQQALHQADHFLAKTEEKWAESEQQRVQALIVAGKGGDPEPLLMNAIATARTQGAVLFELRAAIDLVKARHAKGVSGGDELDSVLNKLDPGVDLPDVLAARALIETMS